MIALLWVAFVFLLMGTAHQMSMAIGDNLPMRSFCAFAAIVHFIAALAVLAALT